MGKSLINDHVQFFVYLPEFTGRVHIMVYLPLIFEELLKANPLHPLWVEPFRLEDGMRHGMQPLVQRPPGSPPVMTDSLLIVSMAIEMTSEFSHSKC